MNEIIEKKLKELPSEPGVYLMKNAQSEIIYVGKAKILKNRVLSYFRKTVDREKTRALVSHIEDLEWITVGTEEEALILECSLIKKYRPKYNIDMMDDKAYPYVRITVDEDFPTVSYVHQKYDDKAKYFGPFSNAGDLHETIDILHRIFPLRTCKNTKDWKNMTRPCLNYGMGRCTAPCMGYISKKDYRKMITSVIWFFEEKSAKIIKEFEGEMNKLAANMEFEKAAIIRNKIQALVSIQAKNRMLTEDELVDMAYEKALEKIEKQKNALIAAKSRRAEGLEKLATLVGMDTPPHRMECYDISHIQGTEVVASMVVAIDGKPEPSLYRRFKIKHGQGNNDFLSMAEVMLRRFSPERVADVKFGELPDLIVIDGGKGQMSSARPVIEVCGYSNIKTIALAERYEWIYFPEDTNPLILDHHDPALKIVIELRDEAHRFAITYHRLLRGKRNLKSTLDDIPGIGPKSKKALLDHFDMSLKKIMKASITDLEAVDGINSRQAIQIYNWFHPEN